MYLPMIAFKHGHGFEMGMKTFKLTKLTPENDMRKMFEQHVEKKCPNGENEIPLSCNEIDRELHWPNGATKLWLLEKAPGNEKIRIEDLGGDRVRVVVKK